MSRTPSNHHGDPSRYQPACLEDLPDITYSGPLAGLTDDELAEEPLWLIALDYTSWAVAGVLFILAVVYMMIP